MRTSEREVGATRQGLFRREIVVFRFGGIWYDLEWRTRMTNDRKVRVFISSTFRDMHAERDWHARFIYPKRPEAMMKTQNQIPDTDLSWGGTSDQDVLELCPNSKPPACIPSRPHT